MSLTMQDIEQITGGSHAAAALPASAGRRRYFPARLVLPTVGVVAFLAGTATMWLVIARTAGGSEAAFAVNGTPLRRAEFMHRLEAYSGAPVVQQMLTEELKLQFARKIGSAPDESDVNAKYDKQSSQSGFAASLAASRQTDADMKRVIRLSMAEFGALTKGVQITDEEIHNYYAVQSDPRNPAARYYAPETVTLAAIVTDKEPDIARASAELAQGAAFADVARKYSKDQSKANGGLLPALRRGSVDKRKLPGLEETAFKMEVGQQIGKTRIAGAWWILRCVNKTPLRSVPFEQVSEECHDGALLAKGTAMNGKRIDGDFNAFREAAHIEAFTPGYKELTGGK
jgi:foldase protein PrsA